MLNDLLQHYRGTLRFTGSPETMMLAKREGCNFWRRRRFIDQDSVCYGASPNGKLKPALWKSKSEPTTTT